MLKNTTLTLTANQSIAPSVVGSLFKADSVSANVTHTINDWSSISFSANGNRLISTTTTDFASASTTYSYSFTRNWTAQFTYRYQHRFENNGTGSTIDPITGTPTVSGLGPANSNSVMVVVSHNYTVLPRGN
jgi:predicted transcriptional regulator